MIGLLRSFLRVAEWDRDARSAALPYLFILCAEVLANAVRKDENIRGINIANVECKLSQYADDTTMILDGSELSLSRTLLLLDNFAISSWLKINYEKTELLWIGSTLGAWSFSCAVSGFGQVLKSDLREKLHSTEWKNLYLCMNLSTLGTRGFFSRLCRSCFRPAADETKLPDALEKKPLVPRVDRFMRR